jgi:cytochrome c oxidase subunit I+III
MSESARRAALPVETTLGDVTIEQDAAALEEVWRDRPGLWGWLTAVDHKEIGKRYIITAFLMFIAGGIEAALMRTHLSRP